MKKVICIFFTIAFCFYYFDNFLDWKYHIVGNKCTETVIHSKLSPGKRWLAKATETVCDNILSVTIISGVSVQPLRAGAENILILGIDSAGAVDEIPEIEWIGDAHLKIVLPAISFLKILRKTVPGMELDIQLLSQDPAQQARFQKAMLKGE